MSFKSLLVKASLGKVPALRGWTDDLCKRARAFAEAEGMAETDEARAQMVLAAHELIAAARRLRGESRCPTPATPEK